MPTDPKDNGGDVDDPVVARLRAIAETDRELGQIRRGQFPDERFVAFIDILGFREILGRMFGDEQELFSVVLEVLELAASFAEESDPENTQAITAFSDSVVVTSGGPFGMAGLSATVGVLVGMLLKRGILCRGGIASGRMYHVDNVLFGEGLVRAYDLERNHAKTPRVLVADDVAPSIFYLVEDRIPRFKRDEDGRLFLNAFNYFWHSDPELPLDGDCWDGSADVEGLLQVREELMDSLSRARNGVSCGTSALEKIRWAAREFNDTLQAIGSEAVLPIPL